MSISDEELINILSARLLLKKKSQKSERELFHELEQLGNKLKQSEQVKSNFLSNIRNEINNPLSSVLGLSRNLMDGNQHNEEQVKRCAYMIHNEIFNLDFQMRNIFAAAEIEAGEINPEPVMMDVNNLIRDTVNTFRFKADAKNIKLAVNTAATAEKFSSDPYMFFIILMNLVANAIEFSLPDSEVVISTLIEDKRLSIMVRDQGLGIDNEHQARIFERFYQLDSGSTKRHTGQGLGLSVTKEFAEILGGELSIKSALAVGSVFTVTLPSIEQSVLSNTSAENWNEFLFDNGEVL